MSLAVNYSIIQLIQKQIFCTEPFRIPFAGKIDVCCFDKTGTLTQNDLVVRGVTGIGNSESDKKRVIEFDHVLQHDKNVAYVIGGCHTLAFAEDNLVGDPLEKQSFEGLKFKQAQDGTRVSSGNNMQITQLKKYLFNSTLKRMSTLVQIKEASNTSYKVVSKGAPEVLQNFLKTVPPGYAEMYLKFVKDGARVLALAYKNVQAMSYVEQQSYSRDEAEKDLIFCGFIVADCPLKPDTLKIIQELKESSHEVKMITGDNALTAAFIGQQLTFGNGTSLFA